MNQATIIVAAMICLVGFGMIFIVRSLFQGATVGGGTSGRSLRDLNAEYRDSGPVGLDEDLITEHGEDSEVVDADLGLRHESNKITLQDKLRYAQLAHVPPYAVSLAQIGVSLTLFLIARTYLQEPLQLLSLIMGPVFVNSLLQARIRKRVAKFDADFPQFLLSVVGMLKTGLNPVQALEAAVGNLEQDSIVRQEVELMLERFRVGVPEDRSIGSFGEDINQPEIELFVQALILSRRVGGNLSETLDRLAKQVRRRHTFKMAATSTVSQQQGAIWVIVMIMVAVELFMLRAAPDMVIGAWTHPKLVDYSQSAVLLIWLGITWMKKITEIKI